MNRKSLGLAIFAMCFLFLATAVFAADEVIFAKTDSLIYSPNGNITVSGTVYSETSPAANTTVSIAIDGSPKLTVDIRYDWGRK